MKQRNEIQRIVAAGLILGSVSAVLVLLGNPANMGICIAGFLRDAVGGLTIHGTASHIRPEIMGLILGSFLMSLQSGTFLSRGGSAPLSRFLLGFCVMVGCLCFLGCPFRMILRLAGGDLNALIGLAGFICGVSIGVLFLREGYSLKQAHSRNITAGIFFPLLLILLLGLGFFVPEMPLFSRSGYDGAHAPALISLAAGLLMGALAQHTRLCMAGSIRDILLFREKKLLTGFIAVFVSTLCVNLLLQAICGQSFFKPTFRYQSISHSAHLWNFLGMLLAGFGSALLGGCPLRQLVLAGEGNTDAVVTVLGFSVGAFFCHNFDLAASADSVVDGVYSVGGPEMNGKIAVIICLIVTSAIAFFHTLHKKSVSHVIYAKV